MNVTELKHRGFFFLYVICFEALLMSNILCAQPPTYRSAFNLYQQKQYQQSLKILTAIPEADRDFKVHYLMGALQVRAGSYELAIESLLKAYREKGDYYDVHKLLALAYLKQSRPDLGKSLKYWKSALAIAVSRNDTKQLFEAHSNTGYLYLRKEEYAKAAPCLQKALKLNSTDTRCLEWYSQTLRGLDCQAALSFYEDYYRQDGHNPEILYNYGQCLIRDKSYETALEITRVLQQERPRSTQGCILYNQIRLMQEPEKAGSLIPEITACLQGDPENGDLLFLLAQTCEQAGDYQKALDYYTILESKGEGQCHWLYKIGYINELKAKKSTFPDKELGKALHAYRKAIQLCPDRDDARSRIEVLTQYFSLKAKQ